jgi:hypothetical protein
MPKNSIESVAGDRENVQRKGAKNAKGAKIQSAVNISLLLYPYVLASDNHSLNATAWR